MVSRSNVKREENLQLRINRAEQETIKNQSSQSIFSYKWMSSGEISSADHWIREWLEWELSPESFREWWQIEQEARQEIRARQVNLAEVEEKEWGIARVFGKDSKLISSSFRAKLVSVKNRVSFRGKEYRSLIVSNIKGEEFEILDFNKLKSPFEIGKIYHWTVNKEKFLADWKLISEANNG